MLEWNDYLVELKTRAENEDLKYFTAKSLLMNRVAEVFDSYGKDHFTYYIVPQSTETNIINGDYILLFRNYKVARVILIPNEFNRDYFSQVKIGEIKNTFSRAIPVDVMLFVWDDVNYSALIVEPYTIKELENTKGVLPKPLKHILDSYFRIPYAKIEKKQKTEFLESRDNRLQNDVESNFKTVVDEFKAKRLRKPNKEAIEDLQREQLEEIAELLSQLLDTDIQQENLEQRLESILCKSDRL